MMKTVTLFRALDMEFNENAIRLVANKVVEGLLAEYGCHSQQEKTLMPRLYDCSDLFGWLAAG
jgi:hypothetical protein